MVYIRQDDMGFHVMLQMTSEEDMELLAVLSKGMLKELPSLLQRNIDNNSSFQEDSSTTRHDALAVFVRKALLKGAKDLLEEQK